MLKRVLTFLFVINIMLITGVKYLLFFIPNVINKLLKRGEMKNDN